MGSEMCIRDSCRNEVRKLGFGVRPVEAQVNDVNAVITRRLVCRLVLMQAESARRYICHLTVRSSLVETFHFTPPSALFLTKRRLERVKALAERGVGGEKENAEALLNRLMAKYSISEEDIEDTAERDYFIRYHNFWERKLIVQIAYKHLGSGHCCGTVGTQSGRPHKKICVTCTPAQYIEIEADFEFYKAAWEEELAIFYSAFISKNDIFPPPELASPSDDDEIDLVRLEKVRAMMSGIDRRTRSKALPGSMEDDDDE